jgi:hypothetical protein
LILRQSAPAGSGVIIMITIITTIEAAQDFDKAIRHALAHYLLIHDAQLLPDFRLDVGTELCNGVRSILFQFHYGFLSRSFTGIHPGPHAPTIARLIELRGSPANPDNVRSIKWFHIMELYLRGRVGKQSA